MMAKGYLGLAVSNNTVRYVYCEAVGQRLSVKSQGIVSWHAESFHPDSLASAVRGILSKLEFHPAKVFLNVSHKSIVIHQKVFPKMSPVELEEAIQGEIEKIPQFFDNEFDFIYQNYPLDDQKNRIVFAAVDQSILNFFNQEIKDIGIPHSGFDITPLNLPKVVSHFKKEAADDVYIVLSDQMTYVAISEKNKFQFFYSSSTGKIDIYNEKAGKINDLGYLHWIEEIKRVMKSFQLHHRSETLQKVWFVWDSENLETLDKNLSLELRLDVEPLRMEQFSCFEQPPEALTAEPSNPIYLLAALPIICYISRFKPDFPLDHFFRTFQVNRYIRKIIAVAMLVILIGGLGIGNLILYYSIKTQESVKTIRVMEKEIVKLSEELKPLHQQRNEFEMMKENLLLQASYVRVLKRISWSRVLGAVAQELPEELSLTSFKFTQRGSAVFEGDALKMESIAKFIRSIDDSEILQNGKFDFLTEKQQQKQKIFKFGIKASLRETADENKSNN